MPIDSEGAHPPPTEGRDARSGWAPGKREKVSSHMSTQSNQQRTRIICTIGPASDDVETIRGMILAGMNVARLNMSHGSQDYHRMCIEHVREAAEECGQPVAIMIDTKGPEIRTGELVDHQPVMLQGGNLLTITTKQVPGDANAISVTYKRLPLDVDTGSHIYIDDGMIELEVVSCDANTVTCTVIEGGLLGEHKGVNIPGVKTSLQSVTDEDVEDIRFACANEVDAIAASFVRDADTVKQIRDLCRRCGRPDMVIFSKLESSLGLANLDEIVQNSDGVMIARGDLGVEIDPAEIPYEQKRIIERSRFCYKPTITATQMLESMTHSPRPTRAEVTDVANAIYDGTDCVMLSGETAAGEYPVETVRMMSKICRNAERYLKEHHEYHERGGLGNVNGAIGFAAVETAKRVGAVAIICPTRTGRSARLMSVFRNHIPLIAVSPSEAAVRRMCFYWGVTALRGEEKEHWSETSQNVMAVAKEHGYVRERDIVMITAGDPETTPFDDGYVSSTNVCMVAQVR